MQEKNEVPIPIKNENIFTFSRFLSCGENIFTFLLLFIKKILYSIFSASLPQDMLLQELLQIFQILPASHVFPVSQKGGM